MAEKKLPPSFGGFVMDADHGRIERILSNDLGRLLEQITDKANLHEMEWKGARRAPTVPGYIPEVGEMLGPDAVGAVVTPRAA